MLPRPLQDSSERLETKREHTEVGRGGGAVPQFKRPSQEVSVIDVDKGNSSKFY